MPDSKLTDLTALTATTNDDLTYVVDDPAGTPLSKKVALRNLLPKATSFPGSPSTEDPFRRTDRHIEYYYDGSQWLSYGPPLILHLHNADVTTFPLSGTSTTARSFFPWAGAHGVYVLDAFFCYVLTGTGNWTITISKVIAGAGTSIASTGAVSTAGRFQTKVAVNAAIPTTDTVTDLVMVATENSGTATIDQCFGGITYRLIG